MQEYNIFPCTFSDYILNSCDFNLCFAEVLSREKGDTVHSHMYHMLYLQVWRLLPGFCTNTVDVSEVSGRHLSHQIPRVSRMVVSVKIVVFMHFTIQFLFCSPSNY